MLTERQLYILKAIVELYEKHGAPIGSKTLLKLKELNYSSATIRNDMSTLEKEGLIEKTHSSSGRIPTAEGYRYYVKHLISPKVKNSAKEKENITFAYQNMNRSFRKLDDIVDTSAKILSDLTTYTAIVLGPEAGTTRLVSFEVIRMQNNQMMVVLIADNGAVDHMIFKLSERINYNDIHKMVAIMEEHLEGETLIEVYRRLQQEIPQLIQKHANTVKFVLDDMLALFQQTDSHSVHVGGMANLLDFMDDRSTQEIKSVYSLFEDPTDLLSLMDSSGKSISVKIGDELAHDSFHDFSLITANYEVENYGEGLIAILGPTNMTYERTIHLLNAFQEILPDTILRFYSMD